MMFTQNFLIAAICIYGVFAQNYQSCTTPDNKNGLCKPIQTCDSSLKLLTTRPLTPEIRQYLQNSQCKTETPPWVCCPSAVAAKKPGKLPKSPKCGIYSEDRIFGGEVTDINEFPWLAQIGYDKSDGKKGYHCGGSIINERYVLTAAHCVLAVPKSWKLSHVRLGEWDTTTNPDCDDSVDGETPCNDPYVNINVVEIINHKNYVPTSKNQHHDISLLRLASNIKYSDFIQPVCLPVESSAKSYVWDSKDLTVAGWGKTETGFSATKKMKVKVKAYPNTDCQKVYTQNIILEEQICAGGKPREDSCNGDSGGPLMGLNVQATVPHYTLVGVVSYGPKNCGTKDYPGVYTRTSKYIEWIQENIYE